MVDVIAPVTVGMVFGTSVLVYVVQFAVAGVAG